MFSRHSLINDLIRQWMPPFIYGFLLLSPFSINLFNINDHYIFEIPLIISATIGAMMRDSLCLAAKSAFRLRPTSILVLLFITFIFLLGWLRTGDFGSAYGDYRASIVLVAGFVVTKQIFKTDAMALARLGLASSILYLIFFMVAVASNPDYLKFPSSYLALTVVAMLACWQRRIKIAEVASLMLFALAAISFYRQYWIAAGLTALSVILFGILRFKSSIKRVPLHVAFLCVFIIFPAYFVFGSHIDGFFSNEAHHYQLIDKTLSFFSTVSGGMNYMRSNDHSDALRFAYFYFIFLHPFSLLIPHGLGYSAVYGKIFPWYFNSYYIKANTIDSLVFFISYHYGILITLVLSCWIAKCYIRFSRRRGVGEATLLFLILLVIAAFDGGQATVILDSFWLGAFLALLSSPPVRATKRPSDKNIMLNM